MSVTYQTIVKCKNPYVSSVVNVISSHNWICMILHPDSSQSVSTNFIIFICSMSIISYIKSNVLAITDVAEPNVWFRT